MLTQTNADYQRVVEDIRLAVNSTVLLDVNMLADCAALYADAIDATNERLRRCGQLLAKGLRAEAIQLSEQDPHLLEVVGCLDFAELPYWNQLLQTCSLQPAPPLLLDVAEQLNRAYAEDQQLSRLFRQHRLLALARAPLASRIGVLRRIRAADPDSTIWQDDLRVWERARHLQLMSEIQQAFRQGNLTALLALAAEVNSADWLQRPSTEVQQTAQGLLARLKLTQARQALQDLVGPLDDAYSAFDVTAGRRVRAQWEAAANIARLDPHDALAERAAPALEWLAAQDQQQDKAQQFAQAVHDLETALDVETPRLELERLYHATQRFDDALPPALLHRLSARLEAFDLKSRRRTRLMLAGIVGAVLVVAGLGAYVVVQQTHRREVAAAADSLARLIEKQQHEDAERFIEDLTARAPLIAAAAPVQELAALLQQRLRDEAERTAAFNNALSRAQAAGAETPDRVALAEAKRLAQGAAEQGEIAMIESAISDAMRVAQEERDRAFTERLRALQVRVLALEELDLDQDAAEADAQTKVLLAEIKAAKTANGVTTLLARQLEPLQARVEAQREQLQTNAAERAELELVIKSAGDASRYTQALLAYAGKFPQSTRGQEYQQVATESAWWQGAAAWNAWAQQEDVRSGKALGAPAATRLLENSQKLVDAHGDYPLVAVYEEQRPYWEAFAARIDDNGRSLIDRTRSLFRDPLMADLYRLTTSNGKQYYLTRRPDRFDEMAPEQSCPFDYISSVDLRTVKARSPKREITKLEVAPQSRLAMAALAHLQKLDDANWDRTFLTLAELVQTHPDVDPILRLAILKRVLEIGSTGSQRFKAVFAQKNAALTAADVDLTASWMVPDDAGAATNRPRAERTLKEIADAPFGESVAQPAVGEVYRWEGLLWRDRDGDWHWRRNGTLPTHGVLAVLVQSDTTERLEFRPVGRCTQQQVQWDTAAQALLREGRPVFWKPDEMPDATANSSPGKGS